MIYFIILQPSKSTLNEESYGFEWKIKQSLDLETFICDLNPRKDCVFKENKHNMFVSGSWEYKTIMPKIRNKKQQKKKKYVSLKSFKK